MKHIQTIFKVPDESHKKLGDQKRGGEKHIRAIVLEKMVFKSILGSTRGRKSKRSQSLEVRTPQKGGGEEKTA